MKLIVGLGNPGKIYIDSRHNIAFSVVKLLAKIYRVAFKKDKDAPCLSAKTKIDDQNVILALPLTFMNLSGIAVSALLKKYKIDLENLLVVCDDLDLELGRMKIKSCGSSGGHRGLQSIIDSLARQNFARLRVGIGRPPHQLMYKNAARGNWCVGRPHHKNSDIIEYVLSAFTKKEKKIISEVIKNAGDCCRVWVTEGLSKSMSMFNRRNN